MQCPIHEGQPQRGWRNPAGLFGQNVMKEAIGGTRACRHRGYPFPFFERHVDPVHPRTWRRLYEACAAGRTHEALQLHRKLIPLLDMAFAETNPGPLKSVLDLVGVHAPRVLQPLVAPAAELREKLRAEMVRLLQEEATL